MTCFWTSEVNAECVEVPPTIATVWNQLTTPAYGYSELSGSKTLEKLLYITNTGRKFSDDIGVNWLTTGADSTDQYTSVASDNSKMTIIKVSGGYKTGFIRLGVGSWANCTSSYTTHHVTNLKICGNNLFANADDTFFNAKTIKSGDDGANWVEMAKIVNGAFSYNYRIVASSDDGQVLIAHYSNKHAISLNAGTSWTLITAPFTQANTDIFTVSGDGLIVYVKSFNDLHLYKSTDNCASFTDLTNLPANAEINSLSSSNDGSILIGSYQNSITLNYYLLISLDGGNTFQSILSSTITGNLNYIVQVICDSTGYKIAITASGTSSGIWYSDH